VARAMERHDGLAVVDTPPGDERIVRAAIERADAVVIPTRAGGVEFTRVVATIEMLPRSMPRGVVVCAARLGTNDLSETIAWWNSQDVPVWGTIPERVGIAAGPDGRLYPEGLDAYDGVLKKALRKRR
jgi:chromosome partitioning protein